MHFARCLYCWTAWLLPLFWCWCLCCFCCCSSDGVKIILFQRSACTSAHLFVFLSTRRCFCVTKKAELHQDALQHCNINVIDYTRFLSLVNLLFYLVYCWISIISSRCGLKSCNEPRWIVNRTESKLRGPFTSPALPASSSHYCQHQRPSDLHTDQKQ